MKTDRLATSLFGVTLRNPVLAASGTCAYGVEFEKLVDWSAVGGLIVKGLSREPMSGNPPCLDLPWRTRCFPNCFHRGFSSSCTSWSNI